MIDYDDTDGVFVRFLHAAGQANVRKELDALLTDGTISLQVANCFVTAPGYIILSHHIRQLQQEHSFVVASVAFPTDLDALAALHTRIPGKVYIHLGGALPKEPHVGRALMHSKVFLAEAPGRCTLWVGSHNLTAMAIEGGNFEAAVIMSGPIDNAVVQDARQHLNTCRDTAELFDPNQLGRYRDMQRGWSGGTAWEYDKDVIVIHAHSAHAVDGHSFIVHINLRPTELASLFSAGTYVPTLSSQERFAFN